MLPITFGLALATGLPAALVVAGFEARFLGWSWSELLRLLAVWVPFLAVFACAGLYIWRRTWLAILRWDGPRASSPGDTWNALTSIRPTLGRVFGLVILAMPVPVIYEVLHFHDRWYVLGALSVCDFVCVSAYALLATAIFELALRPMLEDVAAELPEDFDPDRGALTVRTKALLPLPVVTMFAGLLVGAFADASSNGSARLAIAAGLALATGAIATAIQLIINRSLLAPIDDLLAATQRVRAGDLNKPVPLISTDELGVLAHSFNEMQAGLRQRETLRSELEASRARIVAAADEERRRMERDLHDGAQQHLVLLHLKLGQLSRLIESDPKAATSLVSELREDVGHAQSELRDLAHGIYPQALERDGLRAALQEAVSRAPLPATLDCDGIGRYDPQLEAAVYFCCLEALQNAAKHAGDGARATVTLSERDGGLRFEVADDGAGFDPRLAPRNAGLVNMADRIGALGGALDVRSTSGAGTTITGAVPV